MDLSLSPEQRELAASIRRFAQEQVTPERLTRWEGSADGADDELWRRVSELGWLGLGVPAAAGGSGLGLVDVACLLSECARGLIPTAVSTAVRAADALAQLHPNAPELAAVAVGRRRLSLAIEEERATDPAAFECRLESERLRGSKWFVPHAASADAFVVAAREGDGIALVLVGRTATKIAPLRSFVSSEPQAVLSFEAAPILRRLCGASQGVALLREIRRRQVALALAEMLGGMDAILETTVAYVKNREQFGQKIAVFQAVQHQVADMATAYTAARHLAWQAITRVAEKSDEAIDLPAAAAYVGAAFKQLAVTGHHLHGGAGFVVEHPLHYHSERAQSLAIRHTPERTALAQVAAVLLD